MLIQAFLCLVVAVGRFVLGSSLVFRPIFSLLILWQCFSFVDEPDMGENGKLKCCDPLFKGNSGFVGIFPLARAQDSTR